ncbi:MAG TPA: hypothetical protein VL974_10810 [Magnetospirillum sp.]|jgi:hypothetical protein|nr:hypothetical protein [Magnetospirillum sp.]
MAAMPFAPILFRSVTLAFFPEAPYGLLPVDAVATAYFFVGAFFDARLHEGSITIAFPCGQAF